jgi:hypothetical protein
MCVLSWICSCVVRMCVTAYCLAVLCIRLVFRVQNYLFSFRSPSLFYLPVHSRCRGYFSLGHTQTHTTVGRTPLDEGSVRRRDLYMTTQTLYKRKKIHASRGIRTHDPSKRSVADLRHKPARPLGSARIIRSRYFISLLCFNYSFYVLLFVLCLNSFVAFAFYFECFVFLLFCIMFLLMCVVVSLYFCRSVRTSATGRKPNCS